MTMKKPLSAIAAVLFLTIASCQSRQPFTGNSPSLVRGSRTLSIQELATRLSLRIDEQDATFVVLKGDTNTVLIFTDEGGRFFVNGKPVGPVGTVRKIDGTVYVSEALVGQIRSHLGVATPSRPPRPTQRATIVIDPGHGGRDPGTIAVNGRYEKDVNLSVASKLAGILQRKGHQVTMTRQGDQFPELESRAALANQHNADLFVSIHSDSAPDPSAQGFTVYIAERASRKSQQAAQTIVRAMKTTGLRSRGVRRNDYRVLVKTRGPAVLIELGYLSNFREARKLQDNAFQNRLAVAIAAGIADSLR
jgi:N-acetylmuramoyl-L-alanine amidase